MSTDRDTLVALARWAVIAPATDERLSPAERGRLLSQLAAGVHRDADGRARRYTRRCLYRWLGAWRREGFEGLKPRRRRDAGMPRTDPQILALAAALRREAPARSAAQIAEILAATRGWQVSPRTLQRHFAALGLDRARLEGRVRAFGRFEAAACGDLWIADAWDGPPVGELGGRHAQLFSIIDDRSRLVCHAAFYPDVGEWSFQRCLRAAVTRRGVPLALYVDNGSAFSSGQLKLICARLGVRVTHSAPYRPQGRGKKERWYRTVAEQFAVEADLAGVDTLAELNRYLAAWVEQVYHRRVHRSTGQAPLERWLAGPTALRGCPDPAALAEMFAWTVTRTVTRTATVSLHGNHYLVDASLVGYRVQVRYDPTDLSQVAVYHHGQPAGRGRPEHIGAHVDPKLRNALPPPPGPPTDIAYLQAVTEQHIAAHRDHISYPQPHLPSGDSPPDDTDPPAAAAAAAPPPAPRPPSAPAQATS